MSTIEPVNIYLPSVKRIAINHFEKLKNKKQSSRTSKSSSRITKNRQSPRLMDCNNIGSNDIDLITPIKPTPIKHPYDLQHRKLRRYILEDVMFIKPPHDILLLVADSHPQLEYWEMIIKMQDNGLDVIDIGENTYHQIHATVEKNARRPNFIQGDMDNKDISFHVVGIGGAAIAISFNDCPGHTSIEYKFQNVLSDQDIQIWGPAPMKRNLMQAIKKRTNKESAMILVQQLLTELRGDHSQTIHLVASCTSHFASDTDKGKTPAIDSQHFQSMINNLSSVSFRKALDSLDKAVEVIFKDAIESTFGTFISPTKSIVTQESIQ